MTGIVAWQAVDDVAPAAALQQCQQLFDGRFAQGFLQARQIILFLHQRNEVEPELHCCGPNAEAGVSLAGRDCRRHRQMRCFATLEAVDGSGVDLAGCQQLFDFKPGAGIGLAIDEAHVRALQVAHAGDAFRICGTHHQTLLAAEKSDQLVLARFQ